MYTSYNWMRQRYETQLANELRDKIDFEDMSEDEADRIFDEKMEEWEAGYGDYMYDLMGDR